MIVGAGCSASSIPKSRTAVTTSTRSVSTRRSPRRPRSPSSSRSSSISAVATRAARRGCRSPSSRSSGSASRSPVVGRGHGHRGRGASRCGQPPRSRSSSLGASRHAAARHRARRRRRVARRDRDATRIADRAQPPHRARRGGARARRPARVRGRGRAAARLRVRRRAAERRRRRARARQRDRRRRAGVRRIGARRRRSREHLEPRDRRARWRSPPTSSSVSARGTPVGVARLLAWIAELRSSAARAPVHLVVNCAPDRPLSPQRDRHGDRAHVRAREPAVRPVRPQGRCRGVAGRARRPRPVHRVGGSAGRDCVCPPPIARRAPGRRQARKRAIALGLSLGERT